MAATDADARLPLRSRRALLTLAREAIRSQLERGSFTVPDSDDALLLGPGGAFVSLHIGRQLRGCIGSLDSDRPLVRTVCEMAVAAATEDQRFPPLAVAELRDTELEISVLGPMTPIRAEDVEVGRHGLYVIRGRQRGVLLPQVPVQYGWSRERFLAQACQKAGLPKGAWRDPETRLLGFVAEVFSEEDVLAAEEAERLDG